LEKLALIAIFLMVSLAFIPPFIYVMEWFEYEKSFWLVLWVFAIIVGIILPYAFPRLPRWSKFTSLFMSGWFLSQLIYEVANLFTPEIELESPSDLYVFIKYATCFILGITAIIIRKIIKSWNLQK
jgi:hypothetical protein